MTVGALVCRGGVGPNATIPLFVTHGLGIGAAIVTDVTFASFSPVAYAQESDVEHRRQIASVVNRILGGKLNVNTNLTLTANAATTTLTDIRISPQSFIQFMPRTANAAAELGNGTIYVDAASVINGSCTVNHANNAQTDRKFIVHIIG